ncbi:uncharacterized protein DS421_10g306640 [Arachis hypogaea]|nr:uncharacterized protein DS421_10g306640 [Arachis hypogaea]
MNIMLKKKRVTVSKSLTSPHLNPNFLPIFLQPQRRAAATITAIHPHRGSLVLLPSSPYSSSFLLVTSSLLPVNLPVAASLLRTVSRRRCRRCFSLPLSPLKDPLGAAGVAISVVVVLEPSLSFSFCLSRISFLLAVTSLPPSLPVGFFCLIHEQMVMK